MAIKSTEPSENNRLINLIWLKRLLIFQSTIIGTFIIIMFSCFASLVKIKAELPMSIIVFLRLFGNSGYLIIAFLILCSVVVYKYILTNNVKLSGLLLFMVYLTVTNIIVSIFVISFVKIIGYW